jgi:hypothetical protein
MKSITDIQHIADVLHENLCKRDHNEDCGWDYDTWGNPHYDRIKWYERAESVGKVFNLEQVETFFELLYYKPGV